MLSGSNALAMRGAHSKGMETLKAKIQEAKTRYWDYLKENEWIHDEKAIELEKQVSQAEYELYREEYEDNRRRNWK